MTKIKQNKSYEYPIWENNNFKASMYDECLIIPE
jgi:hypothetical protein